MATKRLQAGDVFELKKGMTVYTVIPSRFVFSNTPHSNNKSETDVEVGESFVSAGTKVSRSDLTDFAMDCLSKYSNFDGVKINRQKLSEAFIIPLYEKQKFDTSTLVGEYVVTLAEYDGGSSGIGDTDCYPDGWCVYAKKLTSRGKFSKSGTNIRFYQSGAFSAVNESVPVIRRLEPTFV